MHILNQVYPLRRILYLRIVCLKHLHKSLFFYQICNNASEKALLNTICLIEFPDPYQENSSQNKTEWLTNNPHGELLQGFHECSHCLMQTTATKSKTLLNVSDFILFQLVIFIVRSGYRCISEIGFKVMY